MKFYCLFSLFYASVLRPFQAFYRLDKLYINFVLIVFLHIFDGKRNLSVFVLSIKEQWSCRGRLFPSALKFNNQKSLLSLTLESNSPVACEKTFISFEAKEGYRRRVPANLMLGDNPAMD